MILRPQIQQKSVLHTEHVMWLHESLSFFSIGARQSFCGQRRANLEMVAVEAACSARFLRSNWRQPMPGCASPCTKQ